MAQFAAAAMLKNVYFSKFLLCHFDLIVVLRDHPFVTSTAYSNYQAVALFAISEGERGRDASFGVSAELQRHRFLTAELQSKTAFPRRRRSIDLQTSQ